jgi:hypothetical protein
MGNADIVDAFGDESGTLPGGTCWASGRRSYKRAGEYTALRPSAKVTNTPAGTFSISAMSGVMVALSPLARHMVYPGSE